MKQILVAVLLFAGVAFASGPTVGTPIVGKWAQMGGPDRIEFKTDGTYVATMTYGYEQTVKTFSGMYAFSNDMVMLSGSVSSAIPAMIWKVKMATQGNMAVTYEDGGSAKFDGANATFQRAR